MYRKMCSTQAKATHQFAFGMKNFIPFYFISGTVDFLSLLAARFASFDSLSSLFLLLFSLEIVQKNAGAKEVNNSFRQESEEENFSHFI